MAGTGISPLLMNEPHMAKDIFADVRALWNNVTGKNNAKNDCSSIDAAMRSTFDNRSVAETCAKKLEVINKDSLIYVVPNLFSDGYSVNARLNSGPHFTFK